ncbi:hypothetical protein GCM10023340_06650 [Nocardioides marinquilinus]|uniref:Uncharacterized protein n=1 Tax=Nocardioides marinquilinus TaxID=1210400 RepID=A0ABP9P954_9ACTN
MNSATGVVSRIESRSRPAGDVVPGVSSSVAAGFVVGFVVGVGAVVLAAAVFAGCVDASAGSVLAGVVLAAAEAADAVVAVVAVVVAGSAVFVVRTGSGAGAVVRAPEPETAAPDTAGPDCSGRGCGFTPRGGTAFLAAGAAFSEVAAPVSAERASKSTTVGAVTSSVSAGSSGSAGAGALAGAGVPASAVRSVAVVVASDGSAEACSPRRQRGNFAMGGSIDHRGRRRLRTRAARRRPPPAGPRNPQVRRRMKGSVPPPVRGCRRRPGGETHCTQVSVCQDRE